MAAQHSISVAQYRFLEVSAVRGNRGYPRFLHVFWGIADPRFRGPKMLRTAVLKDRGPAVRGPKNRGPRSQESRSAVPRIAIPESRSQNRENLQKKCKNFEKSCKNCPFLPIFAHFLVNFCGIADSRKWNRGIVEPQTHGIAESRTWNRRIAESRPPPPQNRGPTESRVSADIYERFAGRLADRGSANFGITDTSSI